MSRAFGASKVWISPFAALTARASFAGALARAISTTVRSGGRSPSAATTAFSWRSRQRSTPSMSR